MGSVRLLLDLVLKRKRIVSYMRSVTNKQGTKTEAVSSLWGEGFLDDFQVPPLALRGKPFWSWNGELEREELLRQLDVVREMGMGGVFMHSRNGLKTEYLGDTWFELVNACAEKAAVSGLEGWIYDEDRWPSGSAGGMATREPTFRMRSIMLVRFAPGETVLWPESEDFLEAHLADLDGLWLGSYEAIAAGSLAVCPPGRQVLVFVREIHPSHSFYNGGSYLDTLNRTATDRFIELTHEKYREKCGQHFGRGIKGVFTDEAHRGFILCDTVNQPGASCSARAIPYTEKLFAEFSARFGYSLQRRLPELFFQLGGAEVSQLKWHYVELLQQLFIENWARPCLQWCEAQGLLLTGHALHEDSLAAQVIPCGSLFRYYEELTYPGIDVLGKNNQAFWVAKQVVSVARQQGKPFVLSELYGCTGWATDFLDHKRIGDWQAILGINLRCHHLSWYSMGGEAKRDYPASIFHQSAWYQEYDYVETYFARIHHVLQQGTPDCDVLVVHPGESLWAQFHLGWASWLQGDTAAVRLLEDKFQQVFRWLTDSQIDFDYGDEEQIGRMARIEEIAEEPLLSLGLMRYRVVVVAGMVTMRGSTHALLRRFIDVGGTVIFAGEPPSHLDARPSEKPEELGQAARRTEWQKRSVVEAVRSGSRQLLSVNGGAGAAGVLSHVRRVEGIGLCVGLVNTTGAAIDGVGLTLPVNGIVEELDCRRGKVQPVVLAEGLLEGLAWEVSFAPWQERLFRISTEAYGSIPSGGTKDGATTAEVQLGGPYGYDLSEPNALVLERARSRIGDGEWQPAEDVLRIDETIRTELGWSHRTGQMVQPWFAKGEDGVGPDLELEYTFFLREKSPEMELVLEQPDRWQIELNGRAVSSEGLGTWFVDTALKRIPLPVDALGPGENHVRLRTKLRPSTDLEAVYLIGSFGVFREGDRFVIGSLPEQVEVGDLVSQGFPFYTGSFTYKTNLPVGFVGGVATLTLPGFAGACARVEKALGGATVAFPPYAVECHFEPGSEISWDVILTRQNLFGPFHRLPKDQGFTGPDSFRTRGEAYSEEFQLFPSGLLTAPLFRF